MDIIESSSVIEPSLLRFIVIAIVAGLVIWRIMIAFKVNRKGKKKKENKSVPQDSRRETIKFLDLDSIHWGNIFKPKPDSDPFLAGLLYVLFGGKRIGCLSSSVLIIIVTVLGAWMLYGHTSILSSLWKVLPILLVLYILSLGISVITYLYNYSKAKDFRYLLQGIIAKDDDKKIEAYQKAVKAAPSEYGYTKLGEYQKKLTDKSEALLNKKRGEYDYTQAIKYYHTASSHAPSQLEPIIARIPLKKRMKDYDGILEDFYLIKEIEKQKKQNSYFATDEELAIIYNDWGADLIVSGEFDQALEKLTEGLTLLNGYTESVVHFPLWKLYMDRASCYYKMGQNELAIKDNYEAIKKLIERLHELINRYSNNEQRFLDEVRRRREGLEEELPSVYLPFKSQEDIEGAITFFYYFYNQKDQFLCPVFAKHLLRLLVDSGQRDQAKNLYQDYLAKGFEKINWFDKWLATDYTSEQNFLAEAKRIRKADSASFNFGMALQRQHFDLALKYYERALEENPIPFAFAQVGQLMERQWKYSKALEYYRKGFNLQEGDYSDERIIGRIKKTLRVFEEAQDCFEGLISEHKEGGQKPNASDVINLAEIYEELGNYDKAIDLLETYDLKDRYPYSELRTKRAIKERMFNY
jgi:tetratricopeptide (TPR) repeat protein